MSFGEKLKSIRQKEGDSLRGLAEKTGITFSYIDKIEKGERPANSEILEKVVREYPLYRKELIKEYTNEYIPSFIVDELKQNDEVVTTSIKNLEPTDVFNIFFKRLGVEDRKELLNNILDKLEFRSYKAGTIEEDKEELDLIRKKIDELK